MGRKAGLTNLSRNPAKAPKTIRFRPWSIRRAWRACQGLPHGEARTVWVTWQGDRNEVNVSILPPRGDVRWLIAGTYNNAASEWLIETDAEVCARELMGVEQ